MDIFIIQMTDSSGNASFSHSHLKFKNREKAQTVVDFLNRMARDDRKYEVVQS